MSRYILTFKKEGYIVYTSHLDMLRLFKRAFRRVGMPLEYSRGFNPHPKMSFAQPLSLGFAGLDEQLEFFTEKDINCAEMTSRINVTIPGGLSVTDIRLLNIKEKSLAGLVTGAVYTVVLPVSYDSAAEEIRGYINDYLSRDRIAAYKQQKKTKKQIEIDIRSKIRDIRLADSAGDVALIMELDQGSSSNLNPELVMDTFLEAYANSIKKYEVSVTRNYLIYDACIPQTIGLHSDK